MRTCVLSHINWYENIAQQDEKENLLFLRFWECMVALNVETVTGREFAESDVSRSGVSFSRDYEMLVVQICLIGRS